MSGDIVRRALMHFKARCDSELFRRIAQECTDKHSGYFPETKTMVHAIVDEAREAAASKTS
jgi:hypothetical protein